MHAGGGNHGQKALQIKKDDKFYNKLLSKESSAANASFRVYYGGASGAVPFLWESCPGTPKHLSEDTALPPLTPPPSYRRSELVYTPKRPSSKSTLFSFLLPQLEERKARKSISPSSLWSSSSVSSSASIISSKLRRRSRYSSSMSSFSSFGGVSGGDEEEFAAPSPRNIQCFGTRHGGFRGCYKMVSVKNVILSIVGHGSR
ncbi:uncharacterized protein LOC144707098 [Wolffia australiana]